MWSQSAIARRGGADLNESYIEMVPKKFDLPRKRLRFQQIETKYI